MFSALLYLLVLSRLWDVAASHRRALGRERAVRQAGASLVAAVTVDAGRGRGQSPRPTPCSARARAGDVLLAVRTDGTLRAVATAGRPIRR